jgi:protein-S-isoprenylcysteine O-methyltransferase Ste14
MVLVIPLFLNRIRIEEELLIEEFGAEYERYRETSRKLIPYLF